MVQVTVIGAKTLAAQQALSNKYGIPTFTTSGKISTVPTNQPINKKINVGLGGFSSSRALNAAINSKIAENTPPPKPKASVTTSTKKSEKLNDSTKTTKSKDIVLGQKTLDAQKKLSEQFKIVTFDPTGHISTIPARNESGKIEINDITGRGIYKTDDEFSTAIANKVTSLEKQDAFASFSNGITNFFDRLLGITPPSDIVLNIPNQADNPITPQVQKDDAGNVGGAGAGIPPTQPTEDKPSLFDKISDFIQKNPIGAVLLIGGGVLIVGGAIGGGRKR